VKKNMLLIGGLVVCIVVGYYLFTKFDAEKTANGDTEETETNTMENADNEKSDNDEKNDQGDVIDDLIKESKQFPADYISDGEKCKGIEDIIERGDCFQAANKTYLDWYISKEKREFHFPYQHDQDHWNNIFYYTVDTDDELGDLEKTEYYDEYTEHMDANKSESVIQSGEDSVEEMWHIFSGIIPEEYRPDLKYVYWTDTGEDYVFAVGRHEEELKDMALLFSHQVKEYYPANKYSLIHEFGHILTMNEQQVKIDEEVYIEDNEELVEKAAADCDTYFTWGCMEDDSYLYSYYQQFWEDIFTDFKAIDWESETDYEDFFFAHEERFMNSYQGTSPHEDIADAFSQYVMINSEELADQTDMKYDKLQFFYEYDELVELRTMILENIYDLSVADETLY